MLNDELAGLAVLSDEEKDELTVDLTNKHNDASQQRQELNTLTQEINWLEKLASLSQEIKVLEEKHTLNVKNILQFLTNNLRDNKQMTLWPVTLTVSISFYL